MNKILKYFSYKKVATLAIKCIMPYNNKPIEFIMKCKLYENKYGDRKINFPLDQFPMSNLRNKELVQKFLNGECTVNLGIPSYWKVINGFIPPTIDDIAIL